MALEWVPTLNFNFQESKLQMGKFLNWECCCLGFGKYPVHCLVTVSPYKMVIILEKPNLKQVNAYA